MKVPAAQAPFDDGVSSSAGLRDSQLSTARHSQRHFASRDGVHLHSLAAT